MEKRRLELSAIFRSILNSKNCYFQPPPDVKLKYPAIVYRLKKIYNHHADNSVFYQRPAFEVTVIEYDPDGPIAMEISKLPTCSHDRNYKADGLNHNVFILY